MEFERKEFYTIEDLLKVVEILRHPEIGCEWDRVQTHMSVRKDFIEETYEAVDAIDSLFQDGAVFLPLSANLQLYKNLFFQIP